MVRACSISGVSEDFIDSRGVLYSCRSSGEYSVYTRIARVSRHTCVGALHIALLFTQHISQPETCEICFPHARMLVLVRATIWCA